MSKGDLIEMNNSWQFCLSIQEVDLLFEYLDLSQNGQINLHSWSRALDPFYTAINAMGRCFHRIVKTKAPKDSGAADADVKMKTKYSFDAAADVWFKRLDKNGDGTLMLTDVKRFLNYPTLNILKLMCEYFMNTSSTSRTLVSCPVIGVQRLI
jgi:hypothetical protein